jgi:hypothetical protein
MAEDSRGQKVKLDIISHPSYTLTPEFFGFLMGISKYPLD